MLEREVDIPTRDGQMNTFITHPEEGGPFPVVLFFMDAPGKREELHDMARRLATVGYCVLLPNLYYRRVREFVMAPNKREEMAAHMNSLTNQMVCGDTESMFEFIEGEDAARGGATGCVGYCMSGPFGFAAAAAFPDRVAAAASLHGVRLCTDAHDSPHLDADKIKAELYFGCAETDEWAPRDMVDALGAHLESVGANHRIEWFPETEHGFVFPLREGKYHKAAAERHWERLFALFARNLTL